MTQSVQDIFFHSKLFAPGSRNFSDVERRLRSQGHDVDLTGDMVMDAYDVLCRLHLRSRKNPGRCINGACRVPIYEQFSFLDPKDAAANLTNKMHKLALDLAEDLSQSP